MSTPLLSLFFKVSSLLTISFVKGSLKEKIVKSKNNKMFVYFSCARNECIRMGTSYSQRKRGASTSGRRWGRVICYQVSSSLIVFELNEK